MKENINSTVNFNVDPIRTPIYFADGYLISSNENALTFNFLQSLPPNPTQQQIISRVALTRSQAKEFLKNLNDHIEKFEI